MKTAALWLIPLVLIGCKDDPADTGACADGQVDCDGTCIDAMDATIESVHEGVFAKSCTTSSCHDADRPAEDLDLSTPEASSAAMVDVAAVQDGTRLLVAPGDADSSYLVHKLEGTDMAPTSGGEDSQVMPLGGGLCDVKIDAVRAWIDAGAP